MKGNKNKVTIGEALDQFVKQFKLGHGLNESRIREKWELLMGKMIANHTEHIQLSKGKLYIRLNSAPLKQELHYGREKIMEILNRELGENVIREVIIQ